MTWEQLPTDYRDMLVNMYETSEEKAKSPAVAALVRMGMKPETAQRRLREHRLNMEIKADLGFEMPHSPTPDFDGYMTVPGDDFVIISDFEVPDHDPKMLLRAMLVGHKFGIRRLVIAGDGIDSSQPALSTHPTTDMLSYLPYRQSVQLLKNILKSLNRQFDEIYYIRGNHDIRLAKKTEGELDLEFLLEDLEYVSYSPYAYMWLETSNGPVYVPHQKNYSKNPVTVGQKLYNTLPRKGHVIVPHCHIQQSGWTEDGEYEVHAIGTCRDPLKTQYKQMNAGAYSQWNQGFVMIKNARFYPFTAKGTDWAFWLGSLARYAA